MSATSRTDCPTNWYNHYTAVGGDWSRMLISDRNSYGGLTMDRILAARTKGKSPPPDPLDEMFDLLIEQGGQMGCVYAHHTEKDMNLAMDPALVRHRFEDGTDAAIDGPLRRDAIRIRAASALFPRVLGVYVQEQGLLPRARGQPSRKATTSQNAMKSSDLTDRGLDPARSVRRRDAVRSREGRRQGHVRGAVPVLGRHRRGHRQRPDRAGERHADEGARGLGGQLPAQVVGWVEL